MIYGRQGRPCLFFCILRFMSVGLCLSSATATTATTMTTTTTAARQKQEQKEQTPITWSEDGEVELNND